MIILDSSMQMGNNDLYLIKKLKESGITIDKLNLYLRKIFLIIKDSSKIGGFTESEESIKKNIIRPIF